MSLRLRSARRSWQVAGVSAAIAIGMAIMFGAAVPASAASGDDTAETSITLTVPAVESTVGPTPTRPPVPPPAPAPSTTPAPAPHNDADRPPLPATGMSPWVWVAAWAGGCLLLVGAGMVAFGRRHGLPVFESETAQ